MSIYNKKTSQRIRRHKRIRAKVSGTALKPRVSVFRSNKYVFVQAIDDDARMTLASAWTRGMKGTLSDASWEAGKKVAADLLQKGIKHAVFDRGGFIYTGTIARVADGLREGGLKM